MKPEEKEDDFASFQADATSWWGQNIYPHHQWRSCCHETLAQKIGIAKQMTTVTHTFQQPVKQALEVLRNGTAPKTLLNYVEGKDLEAIRKKSNPPLLTSFEDIAQSPVPWIWKGWLIRGCFHILAGEASTGKTTLALSLCATLSRGAAWPDGSPCEFPGNVLIWSSEDDPEFTLGPRLTAAGADLSKCHYVGNIGLDSQVFDPAEDMERLEEEIEKLGDVRLIVIDPIVLMIQGDGNSNPQVRRSMQPLVNLAQRHHCAILGITHLNKASKDRSPIDRVNGSLAMVAQPRVAMVTVRKKAVGDGEMPYLLMRIKGNCDSDSNRGGFEYDIEDKEISTAAKRASLTIWGKKVDRVTEEAVREAEADQASEKGSRQQEIQSWLSDLLADGEMLSTEIETKAAGEERYSPRELRRARENMDIKCRREGRRNKMKSYWSLPPQITPQDILRLFPDSQKSL